MLGNQAVYEVFDEAPRRTASPAQAGDCHGMLCGLICAAGFADPKLWLGTVFEAFNPRERAQGKVFEAACEEGVEYPRIATLVIHEALRPVPRRLS